MSVRTCCLPGLHSTVGCDVLVVSTITIAVAVFRNMCKQNRFERCFGVKLYACRCRNRNMNLTGSPTSIISITMCAHIVGTTLRFGTGSNSKILFISVDDEFGEQTECSVFVLLIRKPQPQISGSIDELMECGVDQRNDCYHVMICEMDSEFISAFS